EDHGPRCACLSSRSACTARLTFFHSAATCPHEPEARRTASRRTSRGSGGPTNGTWSAAVKSWAAGLSWSFPFRLDGPTTMPKLLLLRTVVSLKFTRIPLTCDWTGHVERAEETSS